MIEDEIAADQEEIAANKVKAAALLVEGAEALPEMDEADRPDVEAKKEEKEPEKESEYEAKMAASFAALRKQKRHADQILQTAKETLRQAKAEQESYSQEFELAKLLREASHNPDAFFTAAKRAGVPAEAMADFLTVEKQPQTQLARELETAKAELIAIKEYLGQRQRQEMEVQQQAQQADINQAEAQIGERFVGYLVENLDNYPALATQSEDEIRARAIYWAREEYKATGNLPSANSLATFLEHHALQRVQSTLAARRAQVSQKPSQQARTAPRSSGESLTNDDSSEAGLSVDNDESYEVRRKRAIAVLSQNWRGPE